MKNVPIKFRGKLAKTKETNTYHKDIFVTGYYYKDLDGTDRIMQVEGLPGAFAVEPDSVCQLVGYDVNGAEVYENDKLIPDAIHDEPLTLTAALVDRLIDDVGEPNDSLKDGFLLYRLQENR